MRLITPTNKTLEELANEQPENIIVLADSLFSGYRLTSFDNFVSMTVDTNKFTKINAKNNTEAIEIANQYLKDNQYLIVAGGRFREEENNKD